MARISSGIVGIIYSQLHFKGTNSFSTEVTLLQRVQLPRAQSSSIMVMAPIRASMMQVCTHQQNARGQAGRRVAFQSYLHSCGTTNLGRALHKPSECIVHSLHFCRVR